jgi:S1-C subfamily serine protease
VIKLKPAGEDSKPEDGLKVLAVIRDSPAAKANLLRGDVLRKIGDIELQKPEELSAAAKQYQGKTVEIAYERGGESAITKATLNSR